MTAQVKRPLRRTLKGVWWLWVAELGFWCQIPIAKRQPILEAIEDHADRMFKAAKGHDDNHRKAWEAVALDAIENRIDRDPRLPLRPPAVHAPSWDRPVRKPPPAFTRVKCRPAMRARDHRQVARASRITVSNRNNPSPPPSTLGASHRRGGRAPFPRHPPRGQATV